MICNYRYHSIYQIGTCPACPVSGQIRSRWVIVTEAWRNLYKALVGLCNAIWLLIKEKTGDNSN